MGSKITQWVKSNLTLVICGTLAVLSITLVALGFVLPEAQSELEADQAAYSSLQGISGKAANDRTIEEVRRKQNDIRRSVQGFLSAAAKSTPRTLLHSDVFPEVKERFDANEFKDLSDQKRRELLALLNSSDQPDQQDIADYREQMLKAKQQELLQEGKSPADVGLLPGMGNPGLGAGAPNTFNNFNGVGNATVVPENVSPEDWVKSDPHAGASIKRAQEIYCYANAAALDPRSLIEDKYPPVEIMWEAQVSLWIQEDIIQVLSRINNEAAGQLPEEQRWVAHLPIKHLLYIACGDYLKPSAMDMAGARPAGSGSMESGSKVMDPNPPAPTASFTKRQVGEALDVVPVAVGLVIDAGHLLRVMDEISKSGFYTPLLVNYEAVPHDPAFQGYIYGPGPVIRVRLEFEHCILRDKLTIGEKKYVDLMPTAIKTGTWVSPARGGATPGVPRFSPAGGFQGPMRSRDEG